MSTYVASILRTVEIIMSSKYLIAFTGAGISAESGVPTFRGSPDSLWSRFKPEELATPEAFLRNPRRVWEWYVWRMSIIKKAKPNDAHLGLARLEELGILKCVVTQNVDGLHSRAGSKYIIELHGNIWRVKCSNPSCNYKAILEDIPKEIPPKCPYCSSLLRPDVVWFGEPLDPEIWDRAVNEASKADAILVIGTSGVVYPAAYIPLIVKERGGKVIEVNISESGITPYADVFIKEKASKALRDIVRLCEERINARKAST